MKTSRLLALLIPGTLAAQAPAKKAAALTEAQQIASAVLPLPHEFQADAQVLGYKPGSTKLSLLRQGRGAFTCLASDPAGMRFHVACYHKSLEPFMARGRTLREQGVKGEKVDTVRFAEIMSGKLMMPKQPAALYQMSAEPDAYDAATNTVKGAQPLYVIYISGATPASTGLSDKPSETAPWIMFPGTPKAHIMLTPKM
jgi:hypothetical protein